MRRSEFLSKPFLKNFSNLISGLECGPVQNLAVDKPGTCHKPTPRPRHTKKCSGYAGVECCKGYRCVIDNKNGTISDALGDCVPIKNQCLWKGEKCSGKVANPINCCDDFYCQSNSDKTDEPEACVPILTAPQAH